jgi:3-(3-hydroxy-phenyl)propionate hydroxylase
MGADLTHYQVVVVGAGPTGLVLAKLLGRAGVRVLLLERNASTVQEPRAVSIDDESLRTLQAAGVVETALRQIVPGYGSHYRGPSGRTFAVVEPSEAPYGYPRRNAFRQPVLEAQLRQALNEHPTVDARFGWSFRGFEEEDALVRVQTEDGQGGAQMVTANYLVGCDGASSAVRQGLGAILQGATFPERWLILDLVKHANPDPHTTVFCDPTRPCITLPGPDNTRRYEFKLRAGELDEDFLRPETIARLLDSHGVSPGAVLARKVVYHFHARVADRWASRRVAIAGDAAHLTPPFAGQGMNSGLRDAHNLAWKLAMMLDGRAGPRLIETYPQERRPHVGKMIDLALQMGRVMAPRSSLHGALTRALFGALKAFPLARDYILQMRYKPAPKFDAGFLLAPRGPADPRLGRLIPQPRITSVDGQSIPLDDLLGDGFVLLARATHPAAMFAGARQPVWDRLGAIRVALAPNGSPADPAASPDGVRVATEQGEGLEAVAALDAEFLLLRPDRYVAAVIPAAEVQLFAGRVERLLATTW